MVKDSVSLLNKRAMWLIEEFRIEVKILDVRSVWGRKDYLITPLSGEGEKWVSEDRIRLKEEH